MDESHEKATSVSDVLLHEILSFPDATLMSSVFQTVGSDVWLLVG